MKWFPVTVVLASLLGTSTLGFARPNSTEEFDLSLRNLPVQVESSEPSAAESGPEDESESPVLRINYPKPSWLGDRLLIGGDSEQTDGDYRGRLDLSADDLTGLNDALLLNYNRSLAGRADARTRGFGFDYSFPSMFGEIEVNGDLYEYEDSVIGGGRKYQVSGDRQAIDMSARRNVFNLYDIQFDALMGLTTEETNRFQEGAHLESASRHYTSLWFEGRLNYDLGFDTAAFTSVSMKKGMDVLGADGNTRESNGRAEYRKYTVLGSVSKPFLRWTWDLNGHYQYSPDVLPGSQHLLVAGSSLISGFGGQGLAGGQGGWLRFDASSPWHPLLFLSNVHSSLRFSLLKGWISHTSKQPDRYGSASAAEVALKVRANGLTAGLRVGKMLGDSLKAMTKPDSPDVSLTLSLSLE